MRRKNYKVGVGCAPWAIGMEWHADHWVAIQVWSPEGIECMSHCPAPLQGSAFFLVGFALVVYGWSIPGVPVVVGTRSARRFAWLIGHARAAC